MNQPSPLYPVLCIAANGFVSAAPDRPSLETCTSTAFRAGYYDHLELIDTAGQVFHVLDAWEAPRQGQSAVVRIWRRLRGVPISVALKLDASERLALDRVKDRVCEAMAKLPAQWEAVEDLDVAQDRVRRGGSMREIIEMFSGE